MDQETNANGEANLAGAAAATLEDTTKTTTTDPATSSTTTQTDDKKVTDTTVTTVEKPSDLPDEFWDTEKKMIKTDALIKSQRDLRAKVSQGLKDPPPASPEDYKLTQTDGVTISPTDPALALAKTVAHQAGMSQATFDSFVNKFMKEMPALAAKVAEGKQQTPEQIEAATAEANKAELAKIDKDPQVAQKVVNKVVQFFKGKVDQGSLEVKDYAALMRMGGDADGIRALEKIISVVYNEEPVPTGGGDDLGGYSIDQYYRDVRDPRYESEPDFRRSAQEKLAKITGNAPGGSAPRGFGMPTNSRYELPGVDKKK